MSVLNEIIKRAVLHEISYDYWTWIPLEVEGAEIDKFKNTWVIEFGDNVNFLGNIFRCFAEFVTYFLK